MDVGLGVWKGGGRGSGIRLHRPGSGVASCRILRRAHRSVDWDISLEAGTAMTRGHPPISHRCGDIAKQDEWNRPGNPGRIYGCGTAVMHGDNS